MPRIQPVLPLGQYAAFRDRQRAVLAQHQQYAEGLKEKQAQVNVRKTDLDVAGRVMKVLSPTIPKSARQFLNNQLASYLGVDPKSQQFKDMNAMVMGLDPGALQNLSTAFSQQVSSAQPGQIAEITKGLMTGQVPLDSFLNQVDISGGAGNEMMAGGEGGDQLQQPKPATAAPFQGGPQSVSSLQGERTIPPVMQQASPMLVGALGLDSAKRLRTNDLNQQGYRLPMDAKDQEKLANDIVTRTTGISSMTSEVANMVKLFEGRPEVLGPVGGLARGVNTVVRQVEGFLNTVRTGGATVEDPDEYTHALARRVGQQIAKAHGLDVTAEDSARIEAMVLGLAYRMATANDIPGNRLTNGIIQQNLRQLGASGSPEQFKAVLRDTVAATGREFDEFMRRTTGASGYDVMARGIKDGDLRRFSETGNLLPPEMTQAMRQETFYRLNPDKRPQINAASPTLDEEERTLGTMEMQQKERDLAKTQQEMDLAARRDTRAESAEQRAEGREDRMASAQERQARASEAELDFRKSEAAIDNDRADRAQERADAREGRLVTAQEEGTRLQREQLDLTRSNIESDNALQREKFEYEKTQDRAKLDAERGAAIAKAFMEFGKAIAGIGSGSVGAIGGGGAGGGGQDIGAFQLSPTPQRVAPRPAGG